MKLSDWLWPQRILLPCRIQTISLKGPRQENQDNYLVIAGDSAEHVTARYLKNGVRHVKPKSGWPHRWVRLIVFDGLGGHEMGQEIAEAAALELLNVPPCTTISKQRKILIKIHQKLQKRFTSGHSHSPGTTIVWAEIDRANYTCQILNLGDSRAWLHMDGQWQQLTWDHTAVEFNFRDGRIDTATYLTRKDIAKQKLAQALGYGSWDVREDTSGYKTFGFSQNLRIDTKTDVSPQAQDHTDLNLIPISAGAAILLASDGLWNPTKTNIPDLPPVVTTDTAKKLANAALVAGGQDNTTVILGMFSPEIIEDTVPEASA